MANKKEAKNDIDLSKINKELDSKKEDILKEVEDKKEEVIKELDSKIESKVEVAVNEKIKTPPSLGWAEFRPNQPRAPALPSSLPGPGGPAPRAAPSR